MGFERILGLEREGSKYNLMHCEDFTNLHKIYNFCVNKKSHLSDPHDNPTSNFIRSIFKWKLSGLAYCYWLELSDDCIEMVSNNNRPLTIAHWYYCRRFAKDLNLEEFFSNDNNFNAALTYEAEQDKRYKDFDADRDEYEEDDKYVVNENIYMEIEGEKFKEMLDVLKNVRKKRAKRKK